jgi:Pentapeptide repeats (8 copies)
LTGSQLDGANLSSITQLGSTIGGQLGQANFTDANLTGANLSGAVLTGANFTGSILVPSNQTLTATTQAGAVAVWPTPASLPGATPGTCTSPSGSAFPIFSTAVTCQVLDADGDVATGTFWVGVQPTTQYFTRLYLPQSGANLASRTYLDAGAADGPGITKVFFELTGGSLSNQIIATAVPTLVGWLAPWNTTGVPNGTYSLVSVATDANKNTDTSGAVVITVDNPVPDTNVVLPTSGAALSGVEYFDAIATSGVSQVVYEISGGPANLTRQPIATATPTYVGWVAKWDSSGVADGSYTLQSVASYAGGVSGTSAPVPFTVDN